MITIRSLRKARYLWSLTATTVKLSGDQAIPLGWSRLSASQASKRFCCRTSVSCAQRTASVVSSCVRSRPCVSAIPASRGSGARAHGYARASARE